MRRVFVLVAASCSALRIVPRTLSAVPKARLQAAAVAEAPPVAASLAIGHRAAAVAAPPVEDVDGRYSAPAHWSRAAHVQRFAARSVPLAVGGAVLAFPASADAFVASAWALLRSCRWAHAPMFEAWTATLGFVFAIVFWSSAHKIFFRDGARAARFRFDGEAPVAPFEWAGELGWGRLWGAWLPLVAYVGSIKLFHCFVAKAPLPVAPPSAPRLLCEVLGGVAAYDLIFAPIHESMHSSRFPRAWRSIHKTHHAARPAARAGKALVPLETVQHSYADGFLQVACNVFVQRLPTPLFGVFGLCLAPKHPLSRVLHNLIVTFLLAEAHSGFDLPWMSHRVFPRLFGGARAHDAHHVHGDRNFHQFFDLDLKRRR